jgi:hypothetical protein
MWIKRILLGFLFMLMSIGLYTMASGILKLFHIQIDDDMTVFIVAFSGFVVGLFSRIDKYRQKSP